MRPPASRAFSIPEASAPDSRRWLLLFAVLSVGFLLRLWATTATGVWRDEGLFLFVVRMPTCGQMLEFLRWQESHPPLFYLFMRGWLRIFGDSTEAAIAVPLLCGTSLILVIYFVGARMFSPRAGMLASVLYAFSPIAVRYSAQIRPYSLLTVLSLLAVYFLWRGLRQGPPRFWIGYTLVTAASMLIHSWAWLLFGAHGVVALAFVLFQDQALKRWLVRRLVLSATGVVLLYSPWLPALLHQSRHAAAGPLRLPNSLHLGLLAGRAATVSADGLLLGLVVILIASAITAVLIITRLRQRTLPLSRSDSGKRLAFLANLGVPLAALGAAFLLSFRSNLLHEGCASILEPHLLLVVSAQLTAAARSHEPTARRLGTQAVLGIALWLYGYGWSQPMVVHKSNAREVAAAVTAQAQPSDLVVVAPEWLASSFNYYFEGANEQIDFPTLHRKGAVEFLSVRDRLIDPAAYAAATAALRRAKAAGRNIVLIMDCRKLTEAVQESGALPADRMLASEEAGLVRANQLRKFLIGLYGSPAPLPVPNDVAAPHEKLCPFLFAKK